MIWKRASLAILIIVLLATVAHAQRGISVNDGTTTASNRRIALVIGNGDYDTSPLRNPVNDARLVARTLEKLGFDVIKGENLNQNQMKRAMDKFGERLRGGDVGLFFFAGHGIQVDGRNWLVPVGAKVERRNDVEYEAVRAGRVLAKMQDAGSKLNIVLLDACRNNPFTRRFRGAVDKGLAYMDAPTGTLIVYATAPGSVAADGNGSNSPFTGALVRYLGTPGISVDDILKKTGAEVNRKTHGEQQPWVASSFYGEYFFVPKGKGQQQPGSVSKPETPGGAKLQNVQAQCLFEENFEGDYTWPLNKKASTSGGTAYNSWSINADWTYEKGDFSARCLNGMFEASRQGSNGAYGIVQLRTTVNIPVTVNTYLVFRLRPMYSNVRGGSGDGGIEYPATIQLVLDSPIGTKNIYFSYNYRGGKDSNKQRNGQQHRYVVEGNVPQSDWLERKIHIWKYVGDNSSIRQINLISNGWDFQAQWDYVRVEDVGNMAAAYDDYSLDELVEQYSEVDDFLQNLILLSLRKRPEITAGVVMDKAVNLVRKRSFLKGAAAYEIALALKNSQAIHYELGRIYQIMGNISSARKHLNAAKNRGGYIGAQAARMLDALAD